jgi:hypothetical protein
MPVIQFPKWPDIILDLHNIRADINIKVPDFNITKRDISLPQLPQLKLPKINLDAKIELPELYLLKKIELDKLPDLPTLPTVTLPDLPPPPQLPSLFANFQ